MQILHQLSKYKILGRVLFVLAWPFLWFIAPLFLRCRVAIKDKNGNVLLVKHFFGSNVWMLPGGGVKFSESPLQSAIRELHEELSLNVSHEELHALHSQARIYKVSGLIFRVMIYDVTLNNTRIASLRQNYEIRETKWFPADSQEVTQALPRDLSL